MNTKRLVLFYFSGTGNAKRVCNWIAMEAQRKGLSVQVFDIEKCKPDSDYLLSSNTIVGFCTPTHGFNMPPIMLKFIWGFKPSKGTKVFIINTRAGMKLWKLFLPGLSGVAQLLPAFILMLKGFKIIGLQPMDMPSNWISLHPGIRTKIVESIFVRCKTKSELFIGKIINNKKVYKGLWSLPIDLALAPIAFLYYFMGRFVLAKTFVASYKCTGCQLCEKSCPVQAISNSDKNPYWAFTCESCMRCLNNCPEKAIETPHTFVFAVWIFIGVIMEYAGMYLLVTKAGLKPETGLYQLLYNIISVVVVFGLIYVTYRLMHYLLRFKWFCYLITFTSLTRLPFWRRYKPRKAKIAEP